MRHFGRTSLLLGLIALAVSFMPITEALGQDKKKDNSEEVKFFSQDGVELSGTFYPNPAGKRKAVVILLHDFDSKKGGSSSKDNLPDLARALQDDGYAVLSFDFRGFGESKNVKEETFWDARKFPHNGPMYVKRKGAKPPATIEYKNFNAGYYAYLVNDIAAAKAYLDRRNDDKEVNTSNLVVIGAGQGATLGAMWVTNECRRRRDKNPNPLLGQPMLGDPEGKDVAACLWLTISSKIENRNVGTQLQRWLKESGNSNKVPVGFVYAKNDTSGANYAQSLTTHIKGSSKDLDKVVGRIAIDGAKQLTGTKLLEKSLGTNKILIKSLATLLENRGNKERMDRKCEASAYYYLLPGSKFPQINKRSGEESPLVDVNMMLK